jgi:hypothetical protein
VPNVLVNILNNAEMRYTPHAVTSITDQRGHHWP